MEEQEIDWIEDGEKFICFLDIMGFKNMVYTEKHSVVKSIMMQLAKTRQYILDQTLSLKRGNFLSEYKGRDIKVVFFSDSIMFFTNENKRIDFQLLCYAVKKLMTDAFIAGIPIKGAISYGFMTADFENSLFFGRPLVDAYNIQDSLHYYGVVLDHNAEFFLKLNPAELDDQNLFRTLETPFKGGKVKHVNLYSDIEEGDLEKFYNTVSGLTRQYVDNTISVIKKMNDKPATNNGLAQ